MKLLIVILTLVNFALLVPRVTQPIYSITTTSEVDAEFAQFSGEGVSANALYISER